MNEQRAILDNLTALWAKSMGKVVGPDEDFFDVGGTSLKAIVMITEVQSTYGIEIDVESFFELATIARLAASILALRKAGQHKTEAANG